MSQQQTQQTQPTVLNESKSKNIGIILTLLIASFIAIFGIYNNIDYSLFHLIQKLETPAEMGANVGIFVLYIFTMFYLGTLYWKKRDISAKLMIFVILTISLVIQLAIMTFFIQNILLTLWGLLILGITFFLFSLLFQTVGLIGFYVSFALFGSIMTWIVTKGHLTNTTLIIDIVQVFMSLLLFLGATFPRIKNTFLRIGTRDNIDIDNNGSSNDDDDDSSDE